MARRATGTIETHLWRDGRTVTVRARLRAYGRRYRIDFGTNHEGWSVERARVELDRILQQIERGTWKPPDPPGNDPDSGPEADETVHVTASRWWQRRRAELAPNTRLDYRWRIDHVLRSLSHEPTAQLDVRRVDAFRGELETAGLTPRSINMVLDLLAQVLDDAVEYGLLDGNPARGKRRRLKVPTRVARSWGPTWWSTCSTGVVLLLARAMPLLAALWRNAAAAGRGRADVRSGERPRAGRSRSRDCR